MTEEGETHAKPRPLRWRSVCGSQGPGVLRIVIATTWSLNGNAFFDLSEQQVASCDSVALCCYAGCLQRAFDYVLVEPVDCLLS